MGIHSLLGFGLSVPDVAEGRKFYETFGLVGRAAADHVALRCDGRAHDEVTLREGRRKHLHHLRFGATKSGLEQIRARASQRGVREVAVPAGCATDADGAWFTDVDDHLIHVQITDAPASPSGPPAPALNVPGHYDRIGARGCPADGRARPRRLGHVLLFTPDVPRKLRFYSEVFGFRLSDRCGDLIAFTHLPGGGDHHVLAFAKSDRPGFHHASFEVGSIDEIGLGAKRVIGAGYRDGWGLGRHVIGSNFFHYVRDPWNSLAEYFCDIDRIPADRAWDARDFPPEDALYRWGPPPPDDFVRNYESG